MKKTISRIFASIISGLVINVVICVITSLYLMFTIPGDELASKNTLFGIFSVETLAEDNGYAIAMEIGNPVGFIGLWLAISVFIFLCIIAYAQLVGYKKELLAKQNSNNHIVNAPDNEIAGESTSSSQNTTTVG